MSARFNNIRTWSSCEIYHVGYDRDNPHSIKTPGFTSTILIDVIYLNLKIPNYQPVQVLCITPVSEIGDIMC